MQRLHAFSAFAALFVGVAVMAQDEEIAVAMVAGVTEIGSDR